MLKTPIIHDRCEVRRRKKGETVNIRYWQKLFPNAEHVYVYDRPFTKDKLFHWKEVELEQAQKPNVVCVKRASFYGKRRFYIQRIY